MGHAGDAAVVAKLRAMFHAPEGCVVGAFVRVEMDDVDGDERDGGSGHAAALRGIMAMGFDMLAGDGNVEGKTLVGFAQAATDAAMVATMDTVVVGEVEAIFLPAVYIFRSPREQQQR